MGYGQYNQNQMTSYTGRPSGTTAKKLPPNAVLQPDGSYRIPSASRNSKTPTPKFTPEGIWDTYKSAESSAKKANESRYKDILGQRDTMIKNLSKGYQDRYDTSMGMLAGAGTQEKADIQQHWAGEQAKGQQGMVDRGMSNTTVAMNQPLGYGRAMQGDLSRVNERLQQQKLGLHNTLSGDILSANDRMLENKFGFMERREDEYPDLNQMMGLMQGLGQTGTTGATGAGSSTGSSTGSYSPYKSQKVGMAKDKKGNNIHTPFGGDNYNPQSISSRNWMGTQTAKPGSQNRRSTARNFGQRSKVGSGGFRKVRA